MSFSLCCRTVFFVLLCSALPDVVFHCSRYPTLQFPLPCLAVPFPALQSHLPILPYRVLCSSLPYPIHPCRLVYSSCHAVSFVLPCLTLPKPIVSFTLFCHTISPVLPCHTLPNPTVSFTRPNSLWFWRGPALSVGHPDFTSSHDTFPWVHSLTQFVVKVVCMFVCFRGLWFVGVVMGSVPSHWSLNNAFVLFVLPVENLLDHHQEQSDQ